MKGVKIIALLTLVLLISFSSPHSNQKVSKKKIESLTHTDSFLLKPFDLYKFKQKVGTSNSGQGTRLGYYFKPSYNGVYYRFFLFSFLKCYLGTNKDKVYHSESGMRIITYKPVGKYSMDYLDPTEELIEVNAHYNNYDLPELAFNGLDTLEIKKRLGEKSFQKQNCFVYAYKDRVLILGLKGKIVEWLKYVHLNTVLTKRKLMDKLYEEGNYM